MTDHPTHDATPTQLSNIEISPSGLGIYFPRLDANLHVPALLEDFLGSRKWIASRLGALAANPAAPAKPPAPAELPEAALARSAYCVAH